MRIAAKFADNGVMAQPRKKPRTTEPPREWPLGDFLRDARGHLSIRESARRAKISEARWRQVEAGVQRVAGAVDIPVNAKPATIAAMCHALHADANEGLRLAGLDPDAYQHLTVKGVADLPDEVRAWFMRLPAGDRDAVIEDLQRLAASAELRGLEGHG